MGERKQLSVVIGLIRNKEGKILLQKRIDVLIPDANDTWEFPGGKIDFGETPEEALVRETREEVKCDIAVTRLLPNIQSRMWTRTDGIMLQVFVYCYEAELLSGVPKPSDKKVSEVGWFSKEEALNLRLLKGIKEFLEMV